MPAKRYQIEGVGDISIYKRKGSKTIRLSITGDGTVRVTQPRWLPYKAGIEFAQLKKTWIANHQTQKNLLVNDQIIGKSYQLKFLSSEDAQKPTSRLNDQFIVVKLPSNLETSNPVVQKVAERAVLRALKIDTETLLIPRLHDIAKSYGFSFTSCHVKRLKGRWGSCSQKREIILNSYLIQLPWHLIDYVLLHELQHTEILAHGSRFWLALSEHVDNLAEIRKEIKNYQARII